jgi:hypothetical protein
VIKVRTTVEPILFALPFFYLLFSDSELFVHRLQLFLRVLIKFEIGVQATTKSKASIVRLAERTKRDGLANHK